MSRVSATAVLRGQGDHKPLEHARAKGDPHQLADTDVEPKTVWSR